MYFTVFAAFYVEACSENHVKYGVWCAGAVAGLAFTNVFTRRSCVEPRWMQHSTVIDAAGMPLRSGLRACKDISKISVSTAARRFTTVY